MRGKQGPGLCSVRVLSLYVLLVINSYLTRVSSEEHSGSCAQGREPRAPETRLRITEHLTVTHFPTAAWSLFSSGCFFSPSFIQGHPWRVCHVQYLRAAGYAGDMMANEMVKEFTRPVQSYVVL